MKTMPLDVDDIVNKYLSGVPIGKLAGQLNVSAQTITRRLNSVGVDATRIYAPSVEVPRAVAMLNAGRGVSGVALAMGCGRTALVSALTRAGVELRNRSEQQFARWGAMNKEERLAALKSNHDSIRGRPAKRSRLESSAKTKELRRSCLKSPLESIVADMLRARGIETIPQKAFGIYNCDLAADPVAVEIAGGHWHWGGAHLARAEKRFNEIMDSGWHVLMVAITPSSPLTEAVADYIAAYIKKARRNPTAPREYRVIWCAGKFSTFGGLNDDHFSIKPPFTYARDVASGRYKTVPC